MAFCSVRILSALITPPGSSNASNSSGLAWASDWSTRSESPQRSCSHALISPVVGDRTFVSAPSASSARRGSFSSAPSNPSVAMMATRRCFNLSAMPFSFVIWHGDVPPVAGDGPASRLNSFRPDFDDPAPVSETVTQLRVAGIQIAELAQFADGNLPQAIDIAGLHAVHVDIEIAGRWIHDAHDAARMQPIGPELLHQRQRIGRGRICKLV